MHCCDSIFVSGCRLLVSSLCQTSQLFIIHPCCPELVPESALVSGHAHRSLWKHEKTVIHNNAPQIHRRLYCGCRWITETQWSASLQLYTIAKHKVSGPSEASSCREAPHRAISRNLHQTTPTSASPPDCQAYQPLQAPLNHSFISYLRRVIIIF